MSEGRPLRIMPVEDHAIFGDLLAIVLGREPDPEVTAQAWRKPGASLAQAGSLAEAKEALEGHLGEGSLDAAVVELSRPTGGERSSSRSRVGGARGSPLRFAVLSVTVGAGGVEEVRRAGADAVLSPR
jgi:hypothetical protein